MTIHLLNQPIYQDCTRTERENSFSERLLVLWSSGYSNPAFATNHRKNTATTLSVVQLGGQNTGNWNT